MPKIQEKTVKIPKSEYERLKLLDLQFGKLLKYIRYLESIEEAREQIKKGETISLNRILREYKIK